MFSIDVSLRVQVTLLQASGAGASGLTMALTGFRGFMRHPVWTYLNLNARAELDIFKEASRTLARNQMVGYGTHLQTEMIKATKFPAVCYASQQLLAVMGNQRTVRDYKGKFETPHKAMIDAIITKYNMDLVERMDLEDYQGDNAMDVDTWFADKEHVFNSVNI